MYNFSKFKNFFFLMLCVTFCATTVSAENGLIDSKENSKLQPYFFAEGGYGFVAGRRTEDTSNFYASPGFPGYSTTVKDSSTAGSADIFAIGAGLQFPLLVKQSWLQSNSVEVLFSHFTNPVTGARNEYAVAPTETNPRTLTSYQYDVANTLLLFNYQLDFKPIVKRITPFITLGAGLNYSDPTNYSQNINTLGGNTPYIDKVSLASAFNFAYNFGFGVKVAITPHFKTAIGYRYLNTGHIGSGQQTGNDGSQNISLDSPVTANNFNEIYLRFIYAL